MSLSLQTTFPVDPGLTVHPFPSNDTEGSATFPVDSGITVTFNDTEGFSASQPVPPVLIVSGSPAFPYAAVLAIALAVFVVLVVILLIVRKCMVVS